MLSEEVKQARLSAIRKRDNPHAIDVDLREELNKLINLLHRCEEPLWRLEELDK